MRTYASTLSFLLGAALILTACASESDKAIQRLKSLPQTGAVTAVSLACGEVQRLGQLPADLNGRCADAYFEQAKLSVVVGKIDIARNLMNSSVALGMKSEDVENLKKAIDDKAATQLAAQLLKSQKDKAEQNAQAAIAAKALAKKVVEARRAMAGVLRNQFLDSGLDIKVAVSGTDATTMTFTYILFNDVWVHKWGKSGQLVDQLLDMGFKKVNMKDGYNYSISYTRKS